MVEEEKMEGSVLFRCSTIVDEEPDIAEPEPDIAEPELEEV